MISKSSDERVRCVECSEPACREAGDAVPLCLKHFKQLKARKKAPHKEAAEAMPVSLRATAATGDLHNGN